MRLGGEKESYNQKGNCVWLKWGFPSVMSNPFSSHLLEAWRNHCPWFTASSSHRSRASHEAGVSHSTPPPLLWSEIPILTTLSSLFQFLCLVTVFRSLPRVLFILFICTLSAKGIIVKTHMVLSTCFSHGWCLYDVVCVVVWLHFFLTFLILNLSHFYLSFCISWCSCSWSGSFSWAKFLSIGFYKTFSSWNIISCLCLNHLVLCMLGLSFARLDQDLLIQVIACKSQDSSGFSDTSAQLFVPLVLPCCFSCEGSKLPCFFHGDYAIVHSRSCSSCPCCFTQPWPLLLMMQASVLL